MKHLRTIFRRLMAVREPIPRTWALALAVGAIALVLVGYTYLSWHQHQVNANDTTIPSWAQMWEGVMRVIEPQKRTGDRWLLVDAAASGERFALGLGIGVIGAIVLGVHMGAFAAVEAPLYLIMTFLSKVPPPAAFGIFFVLFGTDEKLYVAMVVFAVLPTLAQAICLTLKEFPEELKNRSITLGAGRLDLVWTIMFQWALPSILNAIRLQVGLAGITLILAELAVGSEGFGSQIRAQSRLQNMNVVFTYVVCLVALGYAIDRAIVAVQLLLCPQLRTRGAK